MDIEPALVNQPGFEKGGCELRTSNLYFVAGLLLELMDLFWYHLPSQWRAPLCRLQCFRIDNLWHSLPDPAILLLNIRHIGVIVYGWPVGGHGFMQSAAVDGGVDLPGQVEIIEVLMQLLSWFRPVELTVRVFNVSVEGDCQGVDQLSAHSVTTSGFGFAAS